MDPNKLIAEARVACANTPPAPYVVPVDNDLDLAFDGWEIAIGRCGDRPEETEWTRWTVVSLFVTITGRFVTSVDRYSKHLGQGDRHAARVDDTFEGVIAYLRGEGGRLGPASKEMLDEVYGCLPCLREGTVRRV